MNDSTTATSARESAAEVLAEIVARDTGLFDRFVAAYGREKDSTTSEPEGPAVLKGVCDLLETIPENDKLHAFARGLVGVIEPHTPGGSAAAS